MGRDAEDEQRDGAGRPSDRHGQHEIDGDLGAGNDPERDDDRDESPRDVPPATTDVRADDDGEGCGARDVDVVGEAGADDPRVRLLRRREGGRPRPGDDLLQAPDERPGDSPGEYRHQHGTRAANDDERDDEDDRVQQRDELRHPDEEALERVGQLAEEVQEIRLEADEGVLVGKGDEQRDEEHEGGSRE